jgi:hypothetical protein
MNVRGRCVPLAPDYKLWVTGQAARCAATEPFRRIPHGLTHPQRSMLEGRSAGALTAMREGDYA